MVELMNPELTEADLTALKAQTPHELALGWCKLNRWRWPDWLPDPEEQHHDARDDRRHKAMHWIASQVSERAISRAWNVEDNMPAAQFDDWWPQDSKTWRKPLHQLIKEKMEAERCH